jgi:hypothetical protein
MQSPHADLQDGIHDTVMIFSILYGSLDSSEGNCTSYIRYFGLKPKKLLKELQFQARVHCIDSRRFDVNKPLATRKTVLEIAVMFEHIYTAHMLLKTWRNMKAFNAAHM